MNRAQRRAANRHNGWSKKVSGFAAGAAITTGLMVGMTPGVSSAAGTSSDLSTHAVNPGGTGYWLVTANGTVYAFGNAKYYGGANNIALNGPIVGIVPTPDGLGYWL